jgi:dihydrofolate synthase/folylpolyglutamate synthase
MNDASAAVQTAISMTYPDSVQFLYKLGNEIKSAKMGLERIRAVLAALGNPESAFRIVHVAGTNGKGSTCAMIDAGLRAAGDRTGLFTSPHLLEPTERIQIDGMPVTEGQFVEAFDAVHKTAESLDLDCHPTYFETVTAMAFWLFRKMGVHTAVVEVGLGGRLDATNVVNPVLSVITPIDFDHESYLGHSIESIAAEKAGILKRGVPAVFAKQRSEAEKVLNVRAAELHLKVQRAGEFLVEDLDLLARSSRFSIPGIGDVVCPLPGEHQVDNAVTAAVALAELGVAPDGIADTRWPGRLEHISPNPDVILDGAHNPAGARALASYIERFYSRESDCGETGRRRWIVYGAMRDKSIEEIAGILFPLADELVFTAPNSTRALRPEALVELAGRGRTAPTIKAALELVQKEASANDVVFVTGSLFLVGEARPSSYNRSSWPFSGAWS